MEIRFVGADKLNAKLKQMVAKCPTEMQRFMKMESELVKGRTKGLTPVGDTGRLRGGWYSNVSGLEAIVYNNVYYSPFVEFRSQDCRMGARHRQSAARSTHAPRRC